MMKNNAYRALVGCLMFFTASNANGQAAADAKAMLQRAMDSIGLPKAAGKVVHSKAMHTRLAVEQSDRTYPPFFPMTRSMELWYDITGNVERSASQIVWFGSGPSQPIMMLTGTDRAFMMRDTMTFPVQLTKNKLNILAVLVDWNQSNDVRLGKRTVYRDYERDVLIRNTPDGEERLYLDPKSGLPVKTDMVVSHYLWGQQFVEFVYSTWIQVGDIILPAGAFKLVDGQTEEYFSLGDSEIISPEQAPRMTMPEKTGPPPPQMTALASKPDTVRMSSTTFLTRTRAYTETIALVNDTVYVFDATSGEQRAKDDQQWVEKVFPGKHPVVVVVTDLAWPHISGVRYWVSQGATIVSHRMSESFLRKVVERAWTLKPDELEKKRSTSKFKFIGVGSSLSLAKGKVQLYPIDGPGSEGALMAYLPDEKLLWASDYIQDIKNPSAYANEVVSAVKRVGISPERVVAEHIPVTPWKRIEELQIQK